MIKVFMAIPSVGERADLQCYSLRRIQKAYEGRVELVYPDVFCQRIFHDNARNYYVEEFLKSDCDVMWFLDADVTPPPDILDLVTDPKQPWEAAGAPYPIFMSGRPGDDPKIVLTTYLYHDGKLRCGECPPRGVAFVDGLATGCLFLKKSVFKNLKKPYFEFIYDNETREMVKGEDLGFCEKLAAQGIRFYTDFSMVCRHRKTVDLLEMNNYAMTYAKNAVDAYDRAIRPQIEMLVKEVQRLKSKTGSGIQPINSQIVLPPYLKK